MEDIKIIIIDYSGIAIGTIVMEKLEVNEDLIRHVILNRIKGFRKRFKDKYGEIVIAAEGKKNWRYDVYPHYKAKRKSGRAESSIDWNEVFRITNLVLEELRENFHYKVMQQARCEADDIIAALVENTQEFGNYEPVMIVSADKDFGQLQKYDNVAQYSPATKKFIKEEHPRKQLIELILKGDQADGIPNVLSPDNSFVDSIRQTPLRQKKIEEIMADLDEGELLYAADWYRNYQRNKKLIDLSETPQDLKQEIINTFNALGNKRPDSVKIMNYLMEKRCRNLLEDLGDFV